MSNVESRQQPMELTVDQAWQKAIVHHRSGQLQDAERLYRAILQAQPNHPDANHNLGVLAVQVQQLSASLPHFKAALEANPNQAQYWLSYIDALIQANRPDDARQLLALGRKRGLQGEAVEALAARLGTEAQVKERSSAEDELVRVDSQPDSQAVPPSSKKSVKHEPSKKHKLVKKAISHRAGNPGPHEINALLTLFNKGNYPEVATLAKSMTARFPMHGFGWQILGAALKQSGLKEDALIPLQKAAALSRGDAEAQINLANTFMELERLDEAEEHYRKALAMRPDSTKALFNLASLQMQRNQPSEAIATYRKLLARNPASVEALNNLGLASEQIGKINDAELSYRAALKICNTHTDSLINLGSLLHEQMKWAEAEELTAKAIALQPADYRARNNMARLLHDRGCLKAAVEHLEYALQARPNSAELWNNFGSLMNDLNHADRAEGAFLRALEINHNHAKAHNNLGNLYNFQSQTEKALFHYQHAVQADPEYVDAFVQLIHCRQHACDWRNYDEDQKGLIASAKKAADKVPPFILLNSPSVSEADLLRFAQRFARKFQPESRFIHKPRGSSDRIRIGYLSSDFHDHATARLMAELFELHDRQRFEVFGFSYGIDDESVLRKRLVSAFDRFFPLQFSSHEEAARIINENHIDILVELKGFTFGSRPMIAAYRPAPIQVNYLGYPGSMGADFIDYLIADPVVIPSSAQSYYAEHIVSLPDCYQVNDTKRPIGEIEGDRRDHGLPTNGFVFCSFNNTYKITPFIFDIWMRLLESTPDSVLWLLATNKIAEMNLRMEAQRRRIDPNRLVFAPKKRLSEHLARHAFADLFLDTLPYNAHTTASDALWAGLPVVTCQGETFPGRVCASLLRAVGLPQLITTSLADYESLALRLANSPELLKEMRDQLTSNRATFPLFDSDRFTAHLEAAYMEMWRRWQAGETPRSFSIEHS